MTLDILSLPWLIPNRVCQDHQAGNDYRVVVGEHQPPTAECHHHRRLRDSRAVAYSLLCYQQDSSVHLAGRGNASMSG